MYTVNARGLLSLAIALLLVACGEAPPKPGPAATTGEQAWAEYLATRDRFLKAFEEDPHGEGTHALATANREAHARLVVAGELVEVNDLRVVRDMAAAGVESSRHGYGLVGGQWPTPCEFYPARLLEGYRGHLARRAATAPPAPAGPSFTYGGATIPVRGAAAVWKEGRKRLLVTLLPFPLSAADHGVLRDQGAYDLVRARCRDGTLPEGRLVGETRSVSFLQVTVEFETGAIDVAEAGPYHLDFVRITGERLRTASDRVNLGRAAIRELDPPPALAVNEAGDELTMTLRLEGATDTSPWKVDLAVAVPLAVVPAK